MMLYPAPKPHRCDFPSTLRILDLGLHVGSVFNCDECNKWYVLEHNRHGRMWARTSERKARKLIKEIE